MPASFAPPILHARLRGVCRPHAFCNLRAPLALDDADIILPLQIEPELRTIAKVAPKANGCIGRNRTTTIENVGDAARGHADIK